MRTARSSSHRGGGVWYSCPWISPLGVSLDLIPWISPWVWVLSWTPWISPLGVGLDLIPLNFPLGCGPGSDPPQFPPWVWAWIWSPSISPLGVGLEEGSPWQGGLPGRGGTMWPIPSCIWYYIWCLHTNWDSTPVQLLIYCWPLHDGITTPPWTEWLTDRCKNITFTNYVCGR